jgi:predicted RNase H-like nuclease (RuvC/YqgF family)
VPFCSGIEDLREKREELNRSILRDEEDKAKIQKELTVLTERLSRLNDDLARKMQARNEFDSTIQETEAGTQTRMQMAGVGLVVGQSGGWWRVGWRLALFAQ